MKSVWVNIDPLSDLQLEIMEYIGDRARKKKTPCKRSEIIKVMLKKKHKRVSVEHALKVLVDRHYIRRGYEVSNTTSYIQLRTV